MRGRAGDPGSRATMGALSGPTPISPSRVSPSGAIGNSHPSASELDYYDPLTGLATSIAALTVDVPIVNEGAFALKPKKRQPFRLLDLPSELRLKIYGHYFSDIDRVVDLEHGNWRRVHKPLCILKVCRQVYREASYVFYSEHTFRLFPTTGKFFKAKKPLLARLRPTQRLLLTTLELRLGPGWSQPPRGWVVNEALGLKECVNVRRLNVFVECDPSDNIFNGFRKSDGFYEKFSQDLFQAVLAEMPWCEVVEFDGNPGVKKGGAMMQGLLEVAGAQARRLAWGPEKGWDDGDEIEVVKKPDNGPIGRRSTAIGQTTQAYVGGGGHQHLSGSGSNAMVLA